MATPYLLILLFFFASPDSSHVVAAADFVPPVSFSFNFSNTSEYHLDDLNFLDDAEKPVDGVVELTSCTARCQGRMSYNRPVLLYRNNKNNTGVEVASFATRFTFAIEPIGGGCQGEGMTFFLASYPSVMPRNADGGDLALIDGDTDIAQGRDRFVAVEFDTYNRSTYDPAGNHIGIDLSSVKHSFRTALLPSSLNGSMTADITFNSSSGMLVTSLWLHDHPNSANNPFQVTAQLPNLVTLLPGPEVAVGFSASTGDCKEKHLLKSWSFNSTLAPIPPDGRKKLVTIVGGVIGGTIALVFLSWLMYSCWQQKRIRNTFNKGTGGTRRFDYRDLAAATDDFSEDRKLGQGAFGAVYRGELKQLGHHVAVKKIVRESSEGHKDFFAEVCTINEAKHKNLVRFFGWCSRGYSWWNIFRLMCSCFWSDKNNDLFLVYEWMKKGNLYDYLYKSEDAEVLSWQTRYKIAKGIGSGLLYLHHEHDPYILHRDIKPANVLLDDNFNAKLADFGLSRVASPDNATMETTAIGSQGYLDPQCMKHGKVSFNRSSDVYSFGIALLEIACARRHREQIWDLYRRGGDVIEAADTRLAIGGGHDRTEMKRVIVLGLWCSALETQHRPSMSQAMDVLERGAPLPNLNFIVNSTVASSLPGQDYDSTASAGNGYDGDEAPGNSSTHRAVP
ncbi:L-type lectin-domain containing receptor kinase IX.1-like [Oryza brachyantha]|uniref:non-specific serine/threonine protein kinase n=1 Tax=Oryza brachyantha TaxID=4533 RepID=A0A0U1WXP9_ORYBR|nr:L-type lectin-domain containing receptor kinase IX.1-like [Oryza brachyantha]AHW98487.1 protein kinase [Oryza brachyantha]